MHIIIIGGGAAGLMVAATLAERMHGAEDLPELPVDTRITILEKNKELGTKIRISGGGRCNITTGYFKKKELEGKYIRGRDLLRHSMAKFGPRSMMQRCESHGCPIYCQDDMRCFPVSNVGADVVGMFTRVIGDTVDVHYEEPVVSIEKRDNGTYVVTTSHGEDATQTHAYIADRVVITTGGNAYAHTGSSGDGYTLARSLGHTITPCGPSLNSFLVAEAWVKACSGMSFADAWVTERPVSSGVVSGVASIDMSTKQHIERPVSRGPLLLTHFGISGPATFAYSSHIPLIPISEREPHHIHIRPFADRNRERWLNHFTTTAINHPKKQLLNILCQEFPARRCEGFLHEHCRDIDAHGTAISRGNLYMSNLTREQKNHLATLLGDGFPLTLIARRPGDEFVTAGGVDIAEVDEATLESTICRGLYFAGEVLDVDAVTGGFNFQACWATGRCVGANIKK